MPVPQELWEMSIRLNTRCVTDQTVTDAPLPYALCPIFISYAATRNIHFTFLEIAEERSHRSNF
ncbi:hypothetical protein QUB70_20445 [Microcoleus sp. A003_D6]